ncbi:flagellin, partial [Caulobacter sp. S45]|uniref:flagellin n=1 Tax=Caulobacter sp. S45 TaxID=1641861 RepID=UPI0035304C10
MNPMNSINTNTGAMVALETLNSTNSALETAQNQVSTGLRVAGAQDDGAIWAIAQGQRAQVSSLGAVTDSLNRAASVLDVAVTAGQTISDLLNQMKAKAL